MKGMAKTLFTAKERKEIEHETHRLWVLLRVLGG
jgi:hypothetical protein